MNYLKKKAQQSKEDFYCEVYNVNNSFVDKCNSPMFRLPLVVFLKARFTVK